MAVARQDEGMWKGLAATEFLWGNNAAHVKN